jgi:replicative DNA helicase
MGTLTHRAEQALLGAMLREPGLAVRLDYLESGDFASNRHRVVFTAIMTASRSGQSDRWRRAIEKAVSPEISPQYLDELEAACPDLRHGPAYGVMVLEASARRDLLAHVTDLADQAESLRYTAQRLIRAGGTGGHRSEVHAGLVADAAMAIRVHTGQFDPDSTRAVTAPPSGSTPGRDAFMEETVLAALIQHHPDAPRVIRALPFPLAFADPLRRDIYQTIRDLSATGRPVDALTVDWELARSQGSAGRQRPGDGTVTDDLPSYVTRLADVATAGKAITITASLLTEHLASGRYRQQSAEDRAAPHPGTARPAAPGQAAHLLQPPPDQPGQGPARTRRM